jgi:hypothetical protein
MSDCAWTAWDIVFIVFVFILFAFLLIGLPLMMYYSWSRYTIKVEGVRRKKRPVEIEVIRRPQI